MITPSLLLEHTFKHLEYDPTDAQQLLIGKLCYFFCSREPREVFLINGYAGTGKTSVVAAFVKALHDVGGKFVVLAPTGRAAKVASDFSGLPASTIHKRIYRGDSLQPNAKYFLAPNPSKDTLFIVDEASLITDSDNPNQSLLAQLVKYVYSGQNCRMVLMGDRAQLPPVGMTTSPAMDVGRLEKLGLYPYSYTLDIPMRQDHEGGILHNATRMRQILTSSIKGLRPMICAEGFDDVRVISSADLAEELSSSWATAGIDETIIITRSNIRANKYNNAIRQLVMMAETPLQRGDRIVIAKNDYYWSRKQKLQGFIANGDMAEVKWVGKTEKEYGRYFTEAELYFHSSGQTMTANIMLRSLAAEGPSLPREDLDRLYNAALASSEGELSERIAKMEEDPYVNALQVKYAYCVTCHKAQGGQWKHVYIDMSGIDPENLDESFLRWAYTAMTRATQRLYFINPTIPVR